MRTRPRFCNGSSLAMSRRAYESYHSGSRVIKSQNIPPIPILLRPLSERGSQYPRSAVNQSPNRALFLGILHHGGIARAIPGVFAFRPNPEFMGHRIRNRVKSPRCSPALPRMPSPRSATLFLFHCPSGGGDSLCHWLQAMW